MTVAGAAFAYGRSASTMGENDMGDMMSDGEIGSSDEEGPFDLRLIDQMIMHHRGAIMSEHMISDSERPKLKQQGHPAEPVRADRADAGLA